MGAGSGAAAAVSTGAGAGAGAWHKNQNCDVRFWRRGRAVGSQYASLSVRPQWRAARSPAEHPPLDSAQQVIEQPATVVAQIVKRTGSMPPPPPPAPKPDVAILVLVPAPAPAPAPVETAAAAPEPAPTKLPKTASELPLIGLLGMLFCGLSLATMAIRGTKSRLATPRA